MGARGNEAPQRTGKAVREFAAGGVHKGSRDIAGGSDPLDRVVGALHQGDDHHMVTDAEGTILPLIPHNRLRKVQRLPAVPGLDRIVQRVGSHRAVIRAPLLVDLFKVIIYIVFMHPVALLDGPHSHTDMYAVLDDLRALFDIRPGNLVPLFDKLVGSQGLPGNQCTFPGLDWFHGNHHVVGVLDQHRPLKITHFHKLLSHFNESLRQSASSSPWRAQGRELPRPPRAWKLRLAPRSHRRSHGRPDAPGSGRRRIPPSAPQSNQPEGCSTPPPGEWSYPPLPYTRSSSP